MQIPTKTLKNGFTIPVFGLGTWGVGGYRERDEQNDDQADITAIKTAIEHGITHIDVAAAYAAGHTEVLTRQAIEGYDRKKLFLVSKVVREKLHYKNLIQSAHESLDRLGTDYLDLFLIHGPSQTIDIAESMQAMTDLKKAGLIKEIGVSNFTIERFTAAQAATSEKVVANQLHLNLQYREAERKGLVEYSQKNDVMFIAWRPLQKGLLTAEQNPLLQSLAKKYDKTPTQIALNWVISQPNIVAISMMKTLTHLEENLGAVGWELEPADIELLRNDFPNQQAVSDAVPLI